MLLIVLSIFNMAACSPTEQVASSTETTTKAQTNILKETKDSYYKKLDQKQAELRKKAEQGKPEDQYIYGKFLTQIKEDQKQALEWYRKAAEQGNASAQVRMGDYYGKQYLYEWDMCYFNTPSYSSLEERGLPKEDITQAKIWYNKAARQNNPVALLRLVSINKNTGKTEPTKTELSHSYQQALKAYQNSANAGNPEAQIGLACLYRNGLGIYDYDNPRKDIVILEKDITQTHYWLSKAIAQGDLYALLAQADTYQYYGDEKGFNNTEKAIPLYIEAAKQGHIQSLITLGDIYWRATKNKLSYAKEAIAYYEKASELGSKWADYHIAENYTSTMEERGRCEDESLGDPSLINPLKGIAYFEKAVAKGNAEAAIRLGKIYTGRYEREPYFEEIPVDFTKAKKWYLKAKQMGADIDYEMKDLEDKEKTAQKASAKEPEASAQPAIRPVQEENNVLEVYSGD